MQISYKVTRIDAAANCMDVEFSADGKEPVIVGVRIPFADEDVDQVIQSFAPTSVWFPRSSEPAAVVDGHSGQMTIPLPSEAPTKEDLEAWAQAAFEKQVAAALVKFGVLQSDPTTIGVTQL